MLTKKLVKLIKSPYYLVTMDICIKKSRKDIKNKEETKKKGKKYIEEK